MNGWAVFNGALAGFGFAVWVGNILLARATFRAFRQAREYRRLQLEILVMVWNARAWPYRIALANREAARDIDWGDDA